MDENSLESGIDEPVAQYVAGDDVISDQLLNSVPAPDITLVSGPEDSSGSLEDVLRTQHKVRITEDTFNKINSYSRIVSSIIGKHYEVVGFLVGDEDDATCTAKDAYLISDQEVGPASSAHPGKSQDDAYIWAAENKKKIVGMWHSHGSIPNFHSEDDDNHLIGILLDNAYELPNKLNICGQDMPYAASIVINRNSYERTDPCDSPEKEKQYHCVASFKTPLRQNVLVKGLELEIVVDENKIILDDDVLIQEVCEKVMCQGRYLEDFYMHRQYPENQPSKEQAGHPIDTVRTFMRYAECAISLLTVGGWK